MIYEAVTLEKYDEHINKHGSERKAQNIAWNSSGDYSFKPSFLSYNDDGSPNLYADCIVGLVYKWYDHEKLDRFFISYSSDFRSESFDDLVWLMLESGAYARESETGERPALKELRIEFAKSFFKKEQTLSRQQWMVNNNLVYTMQSARWSSVLGKHIPVMTPAEKRLASVLDCGSDLSTDNIISSMHRVFSSYYHYDGKIKEKHGLRLHIGKRTASFLSKFVPAEIRRSDSLQFNDLKTDSQKDSGVSYSGSKGLISYISDTTAENDRIYIENCFGRSIISPEKNRLIENEMCNGIHETCHLWFTDGTRSGISSGNAVCDHVAFEMNEQYKRNKKYYDDRSDMYDQIIHNLSERVRAAFTSRRSLLVHHSLTGKLEPDIVWKADILGSSHLFLHTEEDAAPDISVTLLLDSSASRREVQEETAAQGYIIGSALTRCHIPVQVMSFCSLRGYTITRIFADETHPENMRNIFRYSAAGWNRDGLALRAAGYIAAQSHASTKLLIILTDASPNDLKRAAAQGKYGLSKDYGGNAAITDTANEVSVLKKNGIHVMAVFSGRDACAENAARIYSDDLVRIRQTDQLAGAVSTLIKKLFVIA